MSSPPAPHERNHAGDVLGTDYDGLGRVVKTVSAQNFATEYDYDVVTSGPSGSLRTTKEASGRTTADRYDAWAREGLRNARIQQCEVGKHHELAV